MNEPHSFFYTVLVLFCLLEHNIQYILPYLEHTLLKVIDRF